MLDYNCPNCQQRLQSPDSAAGTLNRCPQCGLAYCIPWRSVIPTDLLIQAVTRSVAAVPAAPVTHSGGPT